MATNGHARKMFIVKYICMSINVCMYVALHLLNIVYHNSPTFNANELQWRKRFTQLNNGK